jgi:hypothetical protein
MQGLDISSLATRSPDSIFGVLPVSRASSGDGYAKLESNVWIGFNLSWQISIALVRQKIKRSESEVL